MLENMLVTDVVGRAIISSEAKPLGTVENILVNFSRGEADLVVLPKNSSKFIFDASGDVTATIAEKAVSTLRDFLPGGDVIDAVMGEAGKYAGSSAKNKLSRLLTTVRVVLSNPCSLNRGSDFGNYPSQNKV